VLSKLAYLTLCRSIQLLVLLARGHLEQILRVYVAHYNRHRPHRALPLKAPDPAAGPTIVGEDQQGIVHRATCSAVSCTSTNELHERLCAPFTHSRGVRMSSSASSS
jgi:hypothetical protein